MRPLKGKRCRVKRIGVELSRWEKGETNGVLLSVHKL
jgi:hypothetical protein